MKIEVVVLDDNQIFDELRPYADLLPADRQDKIGRYRFERDKLLSLTAGLLIRRAIGGRTLRFGRHGKPYTDEGPCFSVSHSGRIAAIAVDEREIGMDIEEIPEERRLKIADRFYHPCERAYVDASDDRRRAFCEIWTRKEAVLKMTGEGIAADLTAFDTTSLPWSAQLYTTGLDGYCLSVCSEKPIGDRNIDISILELKELL